MIDSERATRLAETCASRFRVHAEDIAVAPAGDELLATRTFPLVAIVVAESTVLLDADEARSLAALLDSELAEGDEPMLAALGTAAEGSARLVADAAELGRDAGAITYRLQGEGITLSVVQLLPASPSEAPGAGAIVSDAQHAVEHMGRISADAAVEVFSALFSEQLFASAPTVAANTGGALRDGEFPLVIGDVSYTGGLEGSTRFCLQPHDVALLAAAMMGTPETTGDGLSPIELSAVSEALNQVMTATAQVLTARLGLTVETSPPSCLVVDSAEQARAHIGETAYRASFHFESAVFGAEIPQEVSPELARSLEGAFASSELEDDGFSISDLGNAFAGVLLEGEPANDAAGEGRAGAREILSGIRVRVSAELGRAKLPIARVANLPGGSVVMLDRAPSDPIDVLVNGTPFAQARIVLVDGEYAVQIVSLSPFEHPG